VILQRYKGYHPTTSAAAVGAGVGTFNDVELMRDAGVDPAVVGGAEVSDDATMAGLVSSNQTN